MHFLTVKCWGKAERWNKNVGKTNARKILKLNYKWKKFLVCYIELEKILGFNSLDRWRKKPLIFLQRFGKCQNLPKKFSIKDLKRYKSQLSTTQHHLIAVHNRWVTATLHLLLISQVLLIITWSQLRCYSALIVPSLLPRWNFPSCDCWKL